MSTIHINPVVESTRDLLNAFAEQYGIDPDDENFAGTPGRVARMYDEILGGMEDTKQQVEEILGSAFPCTNDELVLLKDIEAFSLCPHHLLPVHYRVHVAYIPCGTVVGISKLARLTNVLARRLVLQEQFVADVATCLMGIPGCLGAACIAEGVHYCMVMRGAKQSQATTVTSSLRGAFLHSATSKQELLALIKA